MSRVESVCNCTMALSLGPSHSAQVSCSEGTAAKICVLERGLHFQCSWSASHRETGQMTPRYRRMLSLRPSGKAQSDSQISLLYSLEIGKPRIMFNLQMNKFRFPVSDDVYHKLAIWNTLGGIPMEREIAPSIFSSSSFSLSNQTWVFLGQSVPFCRFSS